MIRRSTRQHSSFQKESQERKKKEDGITKNFVLREAARHSYLKVKVNRAVVVVKPPQCCLIVWPKRDQRRLGLLYSTVEANQENLTTTRKGLVKSNSHLYAVPATNPR